LHLIKPMNINSNPVTRRSVLRVVGAVSLSTSVGGFALAQTSKSVAAEVAISQVVDMSAAQQDISRDFLVGSRAAWQEINFKGGLKGRKLRHTTLETDGSATNLKAALSTVLADRACVTITGSASHTLAQSVDSLLRNEQVSIAHTAPWMQVTADSADDNTFSIFATRGEQISHALKGLSTMNVQEVGAVYASTAEFDLFKDEIDRLATSLQLKTKHFRSHAGSTDMADLGGALKADSPAILLFLGGTPELVRFAKGLDKQARQRYVIAMADVNLHSVAQLGVPKHTSVIATQVVPMVTAGLPVVRAYREALARFYDEPPNAISLAGYISARYTFEVLNSLGESPDRQKMLGACQKLAQVDLGGFKVTTGRSRGSAFVTQSMLSQDGRVIG
jgi:ABC-type branched-subunit amino acid transport system substrate-binding protein